MLTSSKLEEHLASGRFLTATSLLTGYAVRVCLHLRESDRDTRTSKQELTLNSTRAHHHRQCFQDKAPRGQTVRINAPS